MKLQVKIGGLGTKERPKGKDNYNKEGKYQQSRKVKEVIELIFREHLNSGII